jgi:hypothetical protein
MDLRSLILNQQDLPTKAVVIPEWKDAQGKPMTVYVRSLTADERDAFEHEQLAKAKGARRIRASLVSKAVVDDQGKRVFTDADMETLGTKNANALDRLFAAVFELNALSAKDVDDLEKN